MFHRGKTARSLEVTAGARAGSPSDRSSKPGLRRREREEHATEGARPGGPRIDAPPGLPEGAIGGECTRDRVGHATMPVTRRCAQATGARSGRQLPFVLAIPDHVALQSATCSSAGGGRQNPRYAAPDDVTNRFRRRARQGSAPVGVAACNSCMIVRINETNCVIDSHAWAWYFLPIDQTPEVLRPASAATRLGSRSIDTGASAARGWRMGVGRGMEAVPARETGSE